MLPWLKEVIKSEISHLVTSAAHRHEQAEQVEEDDEQSIPVSLATAAYSQDPAMVVLHQEEQEEITKRLAPIYEAVAEDPELAEIVEAVLDGCEPKQRFLMEVIGTTKADINNRLKRLRRRALRNA